MVECWCTRCQCWGPKVSGRPHSAPPVNVFIQSRQQTRRQALGTLDACAEDSVNMHAEGSSKHMDGQAQP